MSLISKETWDEARAIGEALRNGDVYAAFEAGKKAGATEEREACLHALLDLPAADADGNPTDSEDAWQAILARVPEAERTATVNRIHAARAAARGGQ